MSGPPAQVITHGLGRTELNGCRGTVQPRITWTTDRVTVLLATPVRETASISVKQARLTLVHTGTICNRECERVLGLPRN